MSSDDFLGGAATQPGQGPITPDVDIGGVTSDLTRHRTAAVLAGASRRHAAGTGDDQDDDEEDSDDDGSSPSPHVDSAMTRLAKARKGRRQGLSIDEEKKRRHNIARIIAFSALIPPLSFGHCLVTSGYGFQTDLTTTLRCIEGSDQELKALREGRIGGEAGLDLAWQLMSSVTDSHDRVFSPLSYDAWTSMGNIAQPPPPPRTPSPEPSDPQRAAAHREHKKRLERLKEPPPRPKIFPDNVDNDVALADGEILVFLAQGNDEFSPRTLRHSPSMEQVIIFAVVRRAEAEEIDVEVSGVFPYFGDGDDAALRDAMLREACRRLRSAIAKCWKTATKGVRYLSVNPRARPRIASLENCRHGDNGQAACATISGLVFGFGKGSDLRRAAVRDYLVDGAPLMPYEAKLAVDPRDEGAIAIAKLSRGPNDAQPLADGIPRPQHLTPAPATQFELHMEGIALATYSCVIEGARHRHLGMGDAERSDPEAYGVPRGHTATAPIALGMNPPPWDSDLPGPTSRRDELPNWHVCLVRRYYRPMRQFDNATQLAINSRTDEARLRFDDLQGRAGAGDVEARAKLGSWRTSQRWNLSRVEELHKQPRPSGSRPRRTAIGEPSSDALRQPVGLPVLPGSCALEWESILWAGRALANQDGAPMEEAAVQACLLMAALDVEFTADGVKLVLPEAAARELLD